MSTGGDGSDLTEAEVTTLLELPEPGPTELGNLHERLERDAERAGLIDVAFTTIDTPVGSLLLAATDAGLVRIAYDREDHELVLDGLAARLSPRILRVPRRLDDVARELDEYFAGVRTRFEVPLDLSLSSGFRQRVQRQLRGIAYGQTRSYAAVATEVGSPGAVRAVGTACATNPLPVLIPCHRVVRSNGTLGAYIGGTEIKAMLLAMEKGTRISG